LLLGHGIRKTVAGEAAEAVDQDDVERPRRGFCVAQHLDEYRTAVISSGGARLDVAPDHLVAEAFAPAFGLAHLIGNREIGFGLLRRRDAGVHRDALSGELICHDGRCAHYSGSAIILSTIDPNNSAKKYC
jgi:hypothetical protein